MMSAKSFSASDELKKRSVFEEVINKVFSAKCFKFLVQNVLFYYYSFLYFISICFKC